MKIIYWDIELLDVILEKIKGKPKSMITLSPSDFNSVRCEAVRRYFECNGGDVNEGDTWFTIEGIDASFHEDEHEEDYDNAII